MAELPRAELPLSRGVLGGQVAGLRVDQHAVASGAARPDHRAVVRRRLTVALVLRVFTMASLDLYQTFPVWIYVNAQTSGQVSVAASLLALFVTWLFLMLITMIGTRQSRKTGGGQVTLFTVARQETRGN